MYIIYSLWKGKCYKGNNKSSIHIRFSKGLMTFLNIILKLRNNKYEIFAKFTHFYITYMLSHILEFNESHITYSCVEFVVKRKERQAILARSEISSRAVLRMSDHIIMRLTNKVTTTYSINRLFIYAPLPLNSKRPLIVYLVNLFQESLPYHILFCDTILMVNLAEDSWYGRPNWIPIPKVRQLKNLSLKVNIHFLHSFNFSGGEHIHVTVWTIFCAFWKFY